MNYTGLIHPESLPAAVSSDTICTSTMASTWISSPGGKTLQEVQAALTLVVTVLSSLAIFVLVRARWISATRRSAKGQNLALSSFVCLNSLGEVLDAIIVLRTRLLLSRHLGILAQCIVVVILSATSIFSGYVARYASREGYKIREQELTGYLADRLSGAMFSANVQWNQTSNRLDQAQFPLDQLLDYIPADDVDWKFDATQWNNSWTMTCQSTYPQSMLLDTTGSCSDSIISEIPALADSLSPGDYQVSADSWSGFEWNNRWRDIYLFSTAKSQSGSTKYGGRNTSVSISIAAIHMHNVTKNLDASSTCQYGVGKRSNSTLTKITCQIARLEQVPDVNNTAFPDVPDEYQKALSNALTSFYGSRLAQESATKSPITIIQPDELTRFYQTYTVVKDAQYRQPVTRPINQGESIVQVSTIFLAVAAFIALVVLLGLLNYGILIAFQNQAFMQTPLTRLEWMIQSISATSDNTTGSTSIAKGGKHCVTIPADIATMAASDNRMAFEIALYRRNTAVVGGDGRPRGDSTASTGYARSQYSPYNKYPLSPMPNQWEQHATPQILELDYGRRGTGKTPLLGHGGFD